MQLSEHESKELLVQYGIPVPSGRLAQSPDEAASRCKDIEATKFVVKAQIAAGGRGLAGGIKFAATPSAVADETRKLLGSTLVTEQTGSAGEVVSAVYVEAAHDLEDNYFIAIALDPASGQPMLLASSEGGVAFEERARMDSSTVKTCLIGEDSQENRAQLQDFLSEIGISATEPTDMIFSACNAFVENDMTLLEINPYSRTSKGDWLAIDAKISLDNNALFRHPEFESTAEKQWLSVAEMEAQKNNINLVKMDGNIGVVVNGAGLGLATNDMVFENGGVPANFMDIRTTATSFDIAKGVSLLLDEPSTKVILLNIHGGGMTSCDTVAEGVCFAYSRSSHHVPVVARLAGQNSEWGVRILQDRKVPVEAFETMTDAVSRAVELAN